MELEKYIYDKNYDQALSECINTNQNHLGLLLSYILNDDNLSKLTEQLKTNVEGFNKEGQVISNSVDITNDNPNIMDTTFYVDTTTKKYRVKLLCNWTSSEILRETWNKMSQGNYSWNNIELVCDDNPDFFVVINCPPIHEFLDTKKVILFRMEPHMGKHPELWGDYAKPDKESFYKVCYHETDYNNNEWHLSKTYNELKNMKIEKSIDVMSTVLSDKYSDSGHVKRVDFAKFLESKNFPVDVFGSNKFSYKDYKGSLPLHCKDNAMFPYKYVFNVENNSIKNYYTEKLIDGILAECLVFYSGCFNAREFIDEKAFVYLELSNFEEDYLKVKNAIENNLWEERIDIIRKEKKKILEYLQFFPRLERIINKTEDLKY